MVKVVTPQEVGLPEGIGRVRVSTSRARRGKILAIEHPIFGWIPYRQWAILRLIPEERILPAIIAGVSAYWILRITMQTVGAITTILTEPGLLRTFLQPGGALAEFFRFFLAPLFPEAQMGLAEPQLSDLWTKTPIPFYGGLLVASAVLAGVDPGRMLQAAVGLIDALIPG